MKTLLLAALAAMTSVASEASVDMRSRNFHFETLDLANETGRLIPIKRVYNSLSNFEGEFGLGWGSTFETYVEVASEGGIIVHEFGSGAAHRFRPASHKSADITPLINRLREQAANAGKLATKEQAADYAQRLRDDPEFRDDEARRAGLTPKIVAKSQFISTRFGNDYVTVTETGYILKRGNGVTERFDSGGRLASVQLPAGKNPSPEVRIERDPEGRVVKIANGQGEACSLARDGHGRITVIDCLGKKVAYKRSTTGDLASSQAPGGKIYKYDYSTPLERHELAKIERADGTAIAIAYEAREIGKVAKVETIAAGNVAQTSIVAENSATVKDAAGQATTEKFDFKFERDGAGQLWVREARAGSGANAIVVKYAAGTGLPHEINAAGKRYALNYDRGGKLTTPGVPADLRERLGLY